MLISQRPTLTEEVVSENRSRFVLEPLERARSRGAAVLAELAGFGMSSDANDLVQPSSDGAAAAMRIAVEDAGLAVEEVDYVNAHGTGTLRNDSAEALALAAVFGLIWLVARNVDAIAAQVRRDLLLLQLQRLGAGGGVEAAVEHGAGGLGDDADALSRVHDPPPRSGRSL